MSDETAAEPQTERRRRANAPGGRKHKHEVKVTPEEEGRLLRLALAQRVTIPRLLVETTLASETGETVTERRNAIGKLFDLHRLLAAVSNNVNQIAKAVNSTGGEVPPQTDAVMSALRATVQRVNVEIERFSLS